MTYKETLMTNTVMEEYEEDITNRVENMALKFKDNLIKKAELEVDYIDLIISETEFMKEINEKQNLKPSPSVVVSRTTMFKETWYHNHTNQHLGYYNVY